MDYINYTYHGMERIKERMGRNFKDACRIHDLVSERGKDSTNFKGREKEYLESRSYNEKKAVAYNGFCFILGVDNAIVTTYELPNWWMKKKRFDGKEKIRNAKRYLSMNPAMMSA